MLILVTQSIMWRKKDVLEKDLLLTTWLVAAASYQQQLQFAILFCCMLSPFHFTTLVHTRWTQVIKK